MTEKKFKWNTVLMILLGLIILGIWISFMDRAFNDPLPFVVAGLAALLLIAKKVSNLVFHMVGVTLFGIFLIYIERFNEYPLRYTVLGLAFVIITSKSVSRRPTAFYRDYKKKRMGKNQKKEG